MPKSLSGATPRHTVLIADDHAMVRERLVELLTEHGLIVVGAVGEGQLLIDAAMRLRPDVIVTDISMPPGLSGLDVLARLKAERVDSKSSCSRCTTIGNWPRGRCTRAPPAFS